MQNFKLLAIVHAELRRTFANAGVGAAVVTPLFSVPVKPYAEYHKYQPAGGANASDKGRLPHHIRNAGERVSVLADIHHLACRVSQKQQGRELLKDAL